MCCTMCEELCCCCIVVNVTCLLLTYLFPILLLSFTTINSTDNALIVLKMENNKIIPSEIAEVPHHNTHLHTVASNALCTRMYVFN